MKTLEKLTTSIELDASHITMINVFTVEKENQDKLVEGLIEATEKVMNKVPGFVSANIHKSIDGVRVINYTQWESEEAFKKMFANPSVKPHMEELSAIATADYHIYKVAHIDHA